MIQVPQDYTEINNFRFCFNCGQAVNPNDKFCGYCGTHLIENVITDKSPYIWNPFFMDADNIKEFSVSFGDCPNINILYNGEKLTVCNRINPRDGGMNFPDDFFDDKIVNLTDEQKANIINFVKKIDFGIWKKEDIIRENYEMCATGFYINDSLTIIFKNGECFKCYEPKNKEFNQLLTFLKGFCDSKWFASYYESGRSDDKCTDLSQKIYDSDAEYVCLPWNITRMLYGDILRLYDTDKNQEIEIQKAKIDVGRGPASDLQLKNNYVSLYHASFYFEKSAWYIMDKGSTNGTFLNGKRLKENTKYELYFNDVIKFSKRTEYIFYKNKLETAYKGD